ncbi:hypothetical protein EA658_16430 [Pseudoxanthomonas winnipegensis]|uniref:Uncharacterized protein n=1 Tax=Pseudoxanthomonas winnipegensis TaxID=2480810 RepID=A0ABY1WCD7_9GAMM|nr:hypothetical protein [Pseudoxanthomonas winnipegensis]TAA11249.1 hypothetical protein EA659_07845 [Pseudoxanthomonas winnipegensis]TAA18672.1 hypothetical protein EA658_16430 [Pseudoxanthomonas winnipegensis]TAH73952.1 hypothetical protein EA657_00315 [Pseudoxanthomonas winnipegensis]
MSNERDGHSVIEQALATALRADPSDAPFGLDHEQATIWHQATAAAYQHALEMIPVAAPSPPAGVDPTASSDWFGDVLASIGTVIPLSAPPADAGRGELDAAHKVMRARIESTQPGLAKATLIIDSPGTADWLDPGCVVYVTSRNPTAKAAAPAPVAYHFQQRRADIEGRIEPSLLELQGLHECEWCGRQDVTNAQLNDAIAMLANFNPGADEFTSALETLRNMAAPAPGVGCAPSLDQRFAEMLIGIIADIQNELGFSDAEKECSNGSLEIVEAIRQLKRDAQQPGVGEAVAYPYRVVDGVLTVNGMAVAEVVNLGERYAREIDKRGMPRAAQTFEALVQIARAAAPPAPQGDALRAALKFVSLFTSSNPVPRDAVEVARQHPGLHAEASVLRDQLQAAIAAQAGEKDHG